jgi:muramidase (phage lysozyme)
MMEDRQMNTNQKAFLDAIAFSEIGRALLDASDNGYNVLVGSIPSHPLLFESYADHPNVYNAQCDSTAAGRYQILHRFWVVYKSQLRLSDFSPASQDAVALQMIKECHALDDIDAGMFDDAITKCASRWASLPNSTYGQHTNTIAALRVAYRAAGGQLA